MTVPKKYQAKNLQLPYRKTAEIVMEIKWDKGKMNSMGGRDSE